MQFLVMDFQDVRWINSSGIGTLISCLITLRKRGGDIHFANLHGKSQMYFHITKLEKVIKIFDSLDEAVERFSDVS